MREGQLNDELSEARLQAEQVIDTLKGLLKIKEVSNKELSKFVAELSGKIVERDITIGDLKDSVTKMVDDISKINEKLRQSTELTKSESAKLKKSEEMIEEFKTRETQLIYEISETRLQAEQLSYTLKELLNIKEVANAGLTEYVSELSGKIAEKDLTIGELRNTVNKMVDEISKINEKLRQSTELSKSESTKLKKSEKVIEEFKTRELKMIEEMEDAKDTAQMMMDELVYKEKIKIDEIQNIVRERVGEINELDGELLDTRVELSTYREHAKRLSKLVYKMSEMNKKEFEKIVKKLYDKDSTITQLQDTVDKLKGISNDVENRALEHGQVSKKLQKDLKMKDEIIDTLKKDYENMKIKLERPQHSGIDDIVEQLDRQGEMYKSSIELKDVKISDLENKMNELQSKLLRLTNEAKKETVRRQLSRVAKELISRNKQDEIKKAVDKMEEIIKTDERLNFLNDDTGARDDIVKLLISNFKDSDPRFARDIIFDYLKLDPDMTAEQTANIWQSFSSLKDAKKIFNTFYEYKKALSLGIAMGSALTELARVVIKHYKKEGVDVPKDIVPFLFDKTPEELEQIVEKAKDIIKEKTPTTAGPIVPLTRDQLDAMQIVRKVNPILSEQITRNRGSVFIDAILQKVGELAKLGPTGENTDYVRNFVRNILPGPSSVGVFLLTSKTVDAVIRNHRELKLYIYDKVQDILGETGMTGIISPSTVIDTGIPASVALMYDRIMKMLKIQPGVDVKEIDDTVKQIKEIETGKKIDVVDPIEEKTNDIADPEIKKIDYKDIHMENIKITNRKYTAVKLRHDMLARHMKDLFTLDELQTKTIDQLQKKMEEAGTDPDQVKKNIQEITHFKEAYSYLREYDKRQSIGTPIKDTAQMTMDELISRRKTLSESIKHYVTDSELQGKTTQQIQDEMIKKGVDLGSVKSNMAEITELRKVDSMLSKFNPTPAVPTTPPTLVERIKNALVGTVGGTSADPVSLATKETYLPTKRMITRGSDALGLGASESIAVLSAPDNIEIGADVFVQTQLEKYAGMMEQTGLGKHTGRLGQRFKKGEDEGLGSVAQLRPVKTAIRARTASEPAGLIMQDNGYIRQTLGFGIMPGFV